jgi:hypothetical protein
MISRKKEKKSWMILVQEVGSIEGCQGEIDRGIQTMIASAEEAKGLPVQAFLGAV